MVAFIRSDLEFILQQILIAEQNAAGMSLLDLLPNVQVPFGLRTVIGVDNNLVSESKTSSARPTLSFPALCRRSSRRPKSRPPISSAR